MSAGTIGLIMFGLLAVLFLMRVPVGFALMLASIPGILLSGMPLDILPKRLFTACDSFTYMAVPFFLLAGALMSQGGISRRLIAFADALMGRFTGGLGLVSVASCMFFSAISGSSAATTAAIGGIMIPEMERRGYDRDFAAAINAAGGTIGVIIPPSIPFVTYGILTGVSVSTLFLAGFGPGLLMGLALMAVIYFTARRRGYGRSRRAGWGEVGRRFLQAFWALLMPVIVLGGIYSGKFTPTEAAVIAVAYGLLVGGLVYRSIDRRSLLHILKESAVSTAQILLLICAANLFGYVLTYNRIPDLAAAAVLGVSGNKWVILLLIDGIVLLVGTFMDTVASLIILVPILFPVVSQLGVNPVQFGMILCVGLAIGMITPPFGCCLFVACGTAKLSLEALTRRVLPFIGVLVLVLLLVTFFEPVSMLFPWLVWGEAFPMAAMSF